MKPFHLVLVITVAAFSIGRSPCPAQSIAFDDATAVSGVDFRYDAGTRGRHDLPEIMGGGVALFDADGDGLPDLYFCNGGPIGSASPAGAASPCRFYRNRGGRQFENLTEACGAPGPSYAMGASAGDYDGDGLLDLFVTGWGGQRLYHNRGGCRFKDVTAQAGLASETWSTGAAWADLDGDGDLDLYVVSYLDYDPELAPYCAAPDGRRDYCGPEDFDPQADRLYRNDGDGRFTDVSQTAGFPSRAERGLGVLVAELNGDRMPDVYVANDGGRCWLLVNRGGLRFEEVGEAAGVARGGDGRAVAGMGTALGDLDGDGRSDLLVTNFFERSTVAFRAQPGSAGLYRDESNRLGVASATRTALGFGAVVADFDADGRQDVVQINGHVLDRQRLGVPFAMTSILLQGRDRGFEDVSRTAGAWFARPILGRGLAVGDLDDDGRLDLVAASLDAPPALLYNRSKSGAVLRLDLIDRHGGPAVGARIRAVVGGRVLVKDVTGGGSYLSNSSARVFLGIGEADRVDSLTIAWPWGGDQSWSDLRPGKPLRLCERSTAPSDPGVTTPNPDRKKISAPRP